MAQDGEGKVWLRVGKGRVGKGRVGKVWLGIEGGGGEGIDVGLGPLLEIGGRG
jgi:hypothetical protein